MKVAIFIYNENSNLLLLSLPTQDDGLSLFILGFRALVVIKNTEIKVWLERLLLPPYENSWSNISGGVLIKIKKT